MASRLASRPRPLFLAPPTGLRVGGKRTSTIGATPLQVRIEHNVLVDLHDTSVQALDGLERKAKIARPDAGGQPVVGIVCLPNGVIKVLEANDGRDGSEDFLPNGG